MHYFVGVVVPLIKPRKNSLENFLADKFGCVEAFQFNEFDPIHGINLYNF